MRIQGEYLRNLPVLLDQWVDDVDRLDIRERPKHSTDRPTYKRRDKKGTRSEPKDRGANNS